MDKVAISLQPESPYSFALTAAYATFFRGRYGGDTFEDGVYRRLLDLDGCLCLVNVRASGTVDSPLLDGELLSPTFDNALVARASEKICWILSIDQSINQFYGMALNDQILAALVKELRGLHIPHTASVYEALIQAILGQQISSHVARKLRTDLVETYGSTLELAGTVYHSFPRPLVLVSAGVEGLRALGFSARKAEYIIGISAAVASGKLGLESLHKLSNEEIIQILTGIRGVGMWTAQWLLIRALGRDDGFPHDDLALCRVLGKLLSKGEPLKPEEALEHSYRWSPFRSYVTAYLFAAMRSGYVFPSV